MDIKPDEFKAVSGPVSSMDRMDWSFDREASIAKNKGKHLNALVVTFRHAQGMDFDCNMKELGEREPSAVLNQGQIDLAKNYIREVYEGHKVIFNAARTKEVNQVNGSGGKLSNFVLAFTRTDEPKEVLMTVSKLQSLTNIPTEKMFNELGLTREQIDIAKEYIRELKTNLHTTAQAQGNYVIGSTFGFSDFNPKT